MLLGCFIFTYNKVYYLLYSDHSKERGGMEFINYNAKDFVKNIQKMGKYECGICYDVCVDPVKCKGSCQQIYCMTCVSESKNVSNKCPKRCSEPFRVVKLQQFDLQFSCPHSKHCKSSLTSLDSFHNHFQTCEFITPLQLSKQSSKKDYKCQLGHSLEFYTAMYYDMVSSICSQCKEQKLCRSICRKCEQKYCIECRVPPCSKKYCPIGHKFEVFQNEDMKYICDLCGFNAWSFDDKIYDDKYCNFGICKSCHDKLPEEIDNSSLPNIKNQQGKCQCGAQLTITQEDMIKNCSLCQKEKKCPKSCVSCGKSYCLKCKLICLFQNLCELEHEYLPFQTETSAQCMNCNDQNTVHYKDMECGLIICQKCKQYFAEITADKERTRTIHCEKHHNLFFIKNYKKKSMCTKCKEMKLTPLICLKCEDFYCVQCKTIEFTSCYYSHPLKDYQTVSPELKCDSCHIQKNVFKECKKCDLKVCQSCILKSGQLQK